MKSRIQRTNNGIELAIWQLCAVIVAAVACLFAIAPLISRYRSNECDIIYIEKAVKPLSDQSEISSDYHRRYVRDVNPRDQCGVIPPLCSATTVMSTASTASPATTTRTQVSTVSVTRPVITTYSTPGRTTTPDPWANLTRPYDSWRLPTFAKPVDYTLRITCPDCFTLISASPTISFTGQVTIRINILTATSNLVLHAKGLNIIQARLINGLTDIAAVTYLPEFEMIYLSFDPTTLPVGDITLQIDYTGQVNQKDQTGLYREEFWKSSGEISYLLASNFQPIYARRAFPCFDEPDMQATFNLILDHPENSTVALSNNIIASVDDNTTTFVTTQVFSTYSLAWAILPSDEFQPMTKTFSTTTVNIWVRPELMAQLDWTFDVVEKTLEFVQTYLNIAIGDLPTKLDLIGVPDLILDEKASSSWGLLVFREELLNTDPSLNSAERSQTTAKILVEHILQIWFSKTDWWDNIWFGKSLSSYLAYKMIEEHYPLFNLMEQFPIREMVPFMMDDFKPSIWPVSNKNLTTNEQILDYLSISVYSKGASLLRLLEYLSGNETFQTAVTSILPINDLSTILTTFYSKFDLSAVLGTTTTEEFLRSWLEAKNYPIVTVDLMTNNDTTKNTTLTFRQTRYFGSFALNNTLLDTKYNWKVYMECDVGGMLDGDQSNLTGNYEPSKIKFLFESDTEVVELEGEYLWIKCNKDFYSYQVTEYVSYGEDKHALWQAFELLFNTDIFSNVDKANLLNDAFILPHGGEIVSYDQTINLVRELFSDPPSSYLSWSVFVWHWNYLMGVEEHTKYFWNFKQFATRQILAPYGYNIDNIVTAGTTHQDRLVKSMFFELLCRVQNPDALNKATELFRRIPASYFLNSSGATNVEADYLSTVIYYHLQNANDINEWDYLWANLTANQYITSQQRNTFLRGLGSAKEIWRLKSLLETAADTNANMIEAQEFFDIITTISQNPNGRDVVWNFYRHNYGNLLSRFGETNRLFNQLITTIVQSFENEYYYFQMIDFINQYPSSSQNQQLAVDQILINFEWLVDGLAASLDNAISAGDKRTSNN